MRFDQSNARTVLKELGTTELHATMAIQSMFFLPRSSRSDANVTQIIVGAVQRGLRQLGCQVQVDGYFGPKTAACVQKVSGPRWRNKTWMEICQDILNMRNAGERLLGRRDTPALGEVPVVQQAGVFLMVGAIIAGALYLKRPKK